MYCLDFVILLATPPRFSIFLNRNLYCVAFVLCIVWTSLFCLQRLRAASNFCLLYLLLDLTTSYLNFGKCASSVSFGVCKVLKLNQHFINYLCLYSAHRAHSISCRVMPIFFFAILLSRNIHLCTYPFCYVYKIGLFLFLLPSGGILKGKLTIPPGLLGLGLPIPVGIKRCPSAEHELLMALLEQLVQTLCHVLN